MLIIKNYIEQMPQEICLREFCEGITAKINSIYTENGIDFELLRQHPEQRLTASAVIYSAYFRQIWMIGDCQCIADGNLYDNPKPEEEMAAKERANFIKEALNTATTEQLMTHDIGRDHIKPLLISACKGQNTSFSVIDGFKIPLNKTRLINVSSTTDDIILASDGYPFLKPTLSESETILKHQLATDPLCIRTFKATKGLMRGNHSFDDRTYVRFKP